MHESAVGTLPFFFFLSPPLRCLVVTFFAARNVMATPAVSALVVVSSFHQVDSRPTARIPIVIFKDSGSGLECDISVMNPLAVRNTRLLKVMGALVHGGSGASGVVRRRSVLLDWQWSLQRWRWCSVRPSFRPLASFCPVPATSEAAEMSVLTCDLGIMDLRIVSFRRRTSRWSSSKWLVHPRLNVKLTFRSETPMIYASPTMPSDQPTLGLSPPSSSFPLCRVRVRSPAYPSPLLSTGLLRGRPPREGAGVRGEALGQAALCEQRQRGHPVIVWLPPVPGALPSDQEPARRAQLAGIDVLVLIHGGGWWEMACGLSVFWDNIIAGFVVV